MSRAPAQELIAGIFLVIVAGMMIGIDEPSGFILLVPGVCLATMGFLRLTR